MGLSPLPIRLFCDLAARSTVIDLNSGQAATFYRGDDIEIDIGIGQNGALLTGLTNIQSVTLQIFQSETDGNAPMMSANVTQFNSSLTQAQWNAGGFGQFARAIHLSQQPDRHFPQRRGHGQLLDPHHRADDGQPGQADYSS